MTINKKISFIIPIYNVKQYLQECLLSIINQNIPESQYEIICIDDGSTDTSQDIVDQICKDYTNIKVIHKMNGGLSSARNAGLKIALGEYIWFVDSDDFIANACLYGIVKILDDIHPDILVVKSRSFKDGVDTRLFHNEIVSEDESTTKLQSMLWTKIIRRSIIIDNKLSFNINMRYAEDSMFDSIMSPYINHIYKYEKICYFYRLRANSLTSTYILSRINSQIQAIKEFIIASENKKINYDNGMTKACILLTSLLSSIAKLPKDQEKTYINQLRNEGIFPISVNFKYSPKIDYTGNYEQITNNKLKAFSFTEQGYKKFRKFKYWLKFKSRLRKIINMIKNAQFNHI